MANLYPYIFSEDARRQAEFYVQALDGEIVLLRTFGEMPGAPAEIKDKVMHLRLKAAGQLFFLADSAQGPVKRGNGLDLTLEFTSEDEARRAFDGLADGGTVVMPFAKQFWGSMLGRVIDPFGVSWEIAVGL